MKPASARQFESTRPLPCLETSDTKTFARALLAANHARDGILSDVSFADAAWVMLLDLFVSQAHDGRLSLSDLYTSISAPKATTLRTIARLVDQGYLETEADPRDGRRTLVRLTEDTYRQMSEVVEEMRGILGTTRTEV
jgi:DNA-binding MarR family transcriptional regulator